MKIVYILSILYLFITFLMYKKKNNKLSIVSWIVFSICLLFCYNTIEVYFMSLLKLGGSLINYSIVNFIIGTLILGISIYKKEFQQYSFNKKELYLVLMIGLISFLLTYFKFDGFTSISYDSGDPSVHYRQGVVFSQELEILTKENSKDVIYKYFDDLIPISYINLGFLINIFSNIEDYNIFLMYDSLLFILHSMLFLVTIFNLIKNKKDNYLYMIIVTLLYSLAFPLNILMFGFCYLGIGIMIIDLLLLFLYWFKDNLNEGIIFKLVMLFILTLSLFLGYYLFVPCIYLALGIYYIYLWKKKKLKFRNLLLYGIITLIIPFGIGFCKFMLMSFIDDNTGTVLNYVSQDGDRYRSYTPILMYVIFLFYMIDSKINKKVKFNFISLNILLLSVYIFIFCILYITKFSALYFFYKLFYLYWLFMIIYLAKKFIDNKKYVYILFSLIMVSFSIILVFPYSNVSRFLMGLNMYNWNARKFADDRTVYNKNELEVIDRVDKYSDICDVDKNFLIINNDIKNMWFYAITDKVPVNSLAPGKSTLFGPNITFNDFDNLVNHKCAVYFYEDEFVLDDKYQILYENEEGVIIKKKD